MDSNEYCMVQVWGKSVLCMRERRCLWVAWRYRLAVRMVRGTEPAIVSIAASFRRTMRLVLCMLLGLAFPMPLQSKFSLVELNAVPAMTAWARRCSMQQKVNLLVFKPLEIIDLWVFGEVVTLCLKGPRQIPKQSEKETRRWVSWKDWWHSPVHEIWGYDMKTVSYSKHII